MKALAKTVDADRPLNAALARRAGDLGLRRDWSLEWRPGGPGDGGIGREMAERLRSPSVAQALIHELGRGRGIGL